jgi:hypothetical protein
MGTTLTVVCRMCIGPAERGVISQRILSEPLSPLNCLVLSAALARRFAPILAGGILVICMPGYARIFGVRDRDWTPYNWWKKPQARYRPTVFGATWKRDTADNNSISEPVETLKKPRLRCRYQHRYRYRVFWWHHRYN